MKSVITFESLEDRSMPAVLFSPSLIQYQDVDGDWAEIRITQPLFTPENINSILKFDVGSVDGTSSSKQQLQSINLFSLRSNQGFIDLTVTTQAGRRGTGNGRIDVGGIDYYYYPFVEQLAVRDLTINGDLGYLFIGNTVSGEQALRNLRVYSLGVNNTSQGGVLDVNGHDDQIRTISFAGDVEHILVERDVFRTRMQHVLYHVSYAAQIQSLSILGSVISSQFSFDQLETLRIRGNVTAVGSVANSIEVTSITAARIGNALVEGSIRASGSPGIQAAIQLNYIDKLTVRGSVTADTSGSLTQVSITARDAVFHGNIVGGVGGLSWSENSGIEIIIDSLDATDLRYGSLLIKGSMQAAVIVNKNLARIHVLGSVYSQVQQNAPFFSIGPDAHVKELKVDRNIRTTQSNNLQYLIQATGKLDRVIIGGDVTVNSNYQPEGYNIIPAFWSDHPIQYVFHRNVSQAFIFAKSTLSVRIAGNYVNGYIFGYQGIQRVSIGGHFTSSADSQFFGVRSVESIGEIDIGGSVKIDDPKSEMVFQAGYTFPGATTQVANIGKFHVGGSFISERRFDVFDDARTDLPGVYASGSIGVIEIGGQVRNINLFATGQSGQDAIHQLYVGGDVRGAVISAGRSSYSLSDGHSPSSGIGQIRIRGSLIASIISVGASSGWDSQFFTEDDVRLADITGQSALGTIHTIRIDGTVLGDIATSRSYGISADRIQSLRIGGQRIRLQTGPLNDLLLLDTLQQVRVRERLPAPS